MKKYLFLLMALLLTSLGRVKAEELTVYDGSQTSNYVPAYVYYWDDFTRSQTVIPAEDLQDMASGVINGLTFYTNETEAHTTASTADVYLMEVGYTSISAFEPTAYGQMVYQGKLSVAADGKLTIVFSAPYTYEGGNLLIGIENTTDASYKNINFYGQTVDGASVSGYNASGLDAVMPTQRNFIPKTTFDFTPGSGPLCKRPLGLTVSDITLESAVLSWDSDADNFDIEVNGSVVAEGISGNSYTLTGLLPASSYEVRVRTNCGGGEVSAWTGIVSFFTELCAPEDQCLINITLTDSYGDGWNGGKLDVVDVETGKVLGTYTLATGGSSSYSLNVCNGREIKFVYSTGSYATENGWLITDVNDEVIAEHEGCGDGCAVAPGTIATYLVDCSVSPARKPSNLTASGVTFNSAQLSWTENGEATQWEICLNDDEANLVVADSNPFTLTALTPETAYTAKVRAVVGEEKSKWSDAVSFTTPEQFAKPTGVAVSDVTTSGATVSWTSDAAATGSDLRYGIATIVTNEYQYDNGTKGTQVNANGTAFTYAIMLPAGSYSGNMLSKVSVFDNAASTESVTIYSDGTTEPGTQIATKPLTLTGSQTFVEVSFDDLEFDAAKNLWIVVSNNSGNAVAAAADNLNDANGRWTALDAWGDLATMGVPGYVWMIHAEIKSVDSSATTWTTVNNVTSPYQLTGLTDDTTYAVQVRSTYADGSSKWVETGFTTVSLNPLPTNVVAEAQHTTATISWEGENDSYKVKYRKAVAVGPALFTDDFENGLDQWTTVTAGEGPGWVIGTESGSNAATAYSYDNSTNAAYAADNWLISPQVKLGGTLKFTTAVNDNYPDSYEVLLSTTGTDIADFTTTLKAMGIGANGMVSIDLSAYSGTGYIAIHHVSEDMFLLVVDNFTVYDESIPAGEWQEIATDDTQVELTGLEMGTEYDYTVIGIKDGVENAGTRIASFTTLTENDKLFLTAGNWDVDANWIPAGVPTTTNNLIIKADATIPAGVVAEADQVKIDGGSITIKDGGELKQNSNIVVTLEKNIAGYGTGEGNFCLIASPVAVNLASADIEGLLEGTYDYYRFVRTMNLEWRSYQLTSFDLQPGNGALYANQEDKVLRLTGETWPSKSQELSMGVSYNATYPMSMVLAGNPFPCTGTIYFTDNDGAMSGNIYKLNAQGDGFDVYEGYASVAPGEAVLVEYAADGTIYFNSEDYGDGTALGAAENIVLPVHGVMNVNHDAGPVVTLADDATDNSAVIAANIGKTVIVKLAGRTLYKDGSWNTLCLPFNVTLAGSPLKYATAKTLSDATMTGSSVYLTFGDAVTELTAGTPYIIKWAADEENIEEPMFPYVYVNAAEPATVDKADGNVQFTGYYDAFGITAADDDIYYMTADNTLKFTAKDRTLKAMRAYFRFSEAAAARSLVLNFGDVSTAIGNVPTEIVGSGDWYTVDGVKQSGVPVRKGLYLNNGRKVVIK